MNPISYEELMSDIVDGMVLHELDEQGAPARLSDLSLVNGTSIDIRLGNVLQIESMPPRPACPTQ